MLEDIFGVEQLTRDEVGKSNKTMNKATNGGREFHPEGTPNQNSPKRSGKMFFNNEYAEVKF